MARGRLERTLVWQVWERMLEVEFIDRSVALASKGFVSFFPLIIVVAAFMPSSVRSAIFSSLTNRLGISGSALDTAKEAFSSADEVRRATGFLGLILTFFFASSFTTALKRVYIRAWRRPKGSALGTYTRGPAWLAGMLVYLAVMGGLRGLTGDGLGYIVFVAFGLVATPALWTGTAWLMLSGQVRWRVLVPSGVATGLSLLIYGLSASVWMPNLVSKNETQFGFFGVALALVSWFSGAAICVVVGACIGPVLADDRGSVGRLVRGRNDDVLTAGAPPSGSAPTQALRLRDAFTAGDDED